MLDFSDCMRTGISIYTSAAGIIIIIHLVRISLFFLPISLGGRVRCSLPLHPRPLAGEPADRGALLTNIRPGLQHIRGPDNDSSDSGGGKPTTRNQQSPVLSGRALKKLEEKGNGTRNVRVLLFLLLEVRREKKEKIFELCSVAKREGKYLRLG